MSSDARAAQPNDVQISVIENDNNAVSQENSHVVINHRQVNVEVSADTPVVTGRLAWVRNTYPA
ncbi:unnamed protein product, partial [Rotaria sp. Silwood2]